MITQIFHPRRTPINRCHYTYFVVRRGFFEAEQKRRSMTRAFFLLAILQRRPPFVYRGVSAITGFHVRATMDSSVAFQCARPLGRSQLRRAT